MRPQFTTISILVVLAGCTGRENTRAQAPIVRDFVVGGQTVGTTDTLSGTVGARVESTLSFREGGRIVERLVDDGDSVRSGQLLARIDPIDLTEGVIAARSRSLAAERAVDAARATADRTEADERRLRGLAEVGAISRRDYDAAVEGARAARARVDAAKADVQAANAEARVQSNRRGYAELRAPKSGIVTAVFAEPGQVVAAGTPVLRVSQAGLREIVVDVPEQRRDSLPRTATGRLYGGGSVEAVLREVAGAADSTTRTYRAHYRIIDGAPPLGSTVTLTFEDTDTSGNHLVPDGAVTDRGGGPGVWAIERSDRVAWHPVKVIRTDGESTTLQGLSPGTRIVALGAHLLQPGQAVRVQSPRRAVATR